ncbi:MAG: M28 family metallopeptidase [Bryobacteraceae bacterium]
MPGFSAVRLRLAAVSILPTFIFLAVIVAVGEHRATSQSANSDAPQIPLGFTPRSYDGERAWEEKLKRLVSPERCRMYLHKLTAEPHVAGTPGDRRVSEYIAREFRGDGLETEVVEYKVLLSYPKQVSLELVAPVTRRLANPEPSIDGDPDTQVSDPMARMPWNGYSPSADITRSVVYANYGRAEDYDRLETMHVNVKGQIVLARYFQGYRGGKSLEAERRGAAAVIVYSDPAEDGASKGKVYPDGPWGPVGHLQRGAVVYDFLVPGDPLTPGWASTQQARRIPERDSKILPKIPMIPLSAADAEQILSEMRGPQAPDGWHGGLRSTTGPYRVGDGSTQVHLALRMENRVTPIWDVIGRIRGSEEPEKLVILSNHHDAWVYGAVDPASGTAAMLELARAFGQMLREGFRPRRTIVFGNWDAEEFTLTGSTEWGEEHEGELRKSGVVCLNVDSATSGNKFSLSTVPAMLHATIDAAKTVSDPATNGSVYDAWKMQGNEKENVRSYRVEGAAGAPVPYGVLGGGSDFMVFLQHDGVPSLDMIFDGPYGVYHSLYDDFEWMTRFGDPTFRYHATMSRLWGVLALRFANADVVPLDYSLYAHEVAVYLSELDKIAPPSLQFELELLIGKCQTWQTAAAAVSSEVKQLSSHAGKSSQVSSEVLNRAIMTEERALLAIGGVPGRPWFRHLIYAPLPSYAAETLPGVREALSANDLNRSRAQIRELAAALDRATTALVEIRGSRVQ